MLVQEVMTSGAECLQPDTTLRQAAEQMKRLDVGAMPICGKDDRLAGMLTDRDIVIRGIAEGRNPDKTAVDEVMTPEVVYCFDDQQAEDAATLMKERQIRRLMVINRDKRLVGMLSLGDLAVKGGNEQVCGQTLEQVSEPAMPRR